MPRRAPAPAILSALVFAFLSRHAAAVERTYQIVVSKALYCRSKALTGTACTDADPTVAALAQAKDYGLLVTGDDDSNGWLTVAVGSKPPLYVPYQVGSMIWMSPFTVVGSVYKIGQGTCGSWGYLPINDKRTCQLAANALNLVPDDITPSTAAARPEGCYWFTQGLTTGLYLSTELNSIGNGADTGTPSRQPLCSTPGPTSTTSVTQTKSTTTSTTTPATTAAGTGGQAGSQTGGSSGGSGSSGGTSQGGSSSVLTSTTTGSGAGAKLGVGPIIAIAISAAVIGAVGAIGVSMCMRRKNNPYNAYQDHADPANSLPVMQAKSSLGGMSEPISVRVAHPKKRSKNRNSTEATAASSAAGPSPSYVLPVPSAMQGPRQSKSKQPVPATVGFSGVMPAVAERSGPMESNAAAASDASVWRPAGPTPSQQRQGQGRQQDRQEVDAAVKIQSVFRGRRQRTQTALIKQGAGDNTLRNFIAIDKE